MRYAIRIITLTLILSTAALTGCGPPNTDPKPVSVNVNEDARINADMEKALKKKGKTVVEAK
jgi:hypothetical protein